MNEAAVNTYTITGTIEFTKIVKTPYTVKGDLSQSIQENFPSLVEEKMKELFDQAVVSDVKVFSTAEAEKEEPNVDSERA